MSQLQNEKQNEPVAPAAATPGNISDNSEITALADTKSGVPQKTDVKSLLLKIWKALKEYSVVPDDAVVEQEPVPEKPFRETLRDFTDRWRDPKKRFEMLKGFGKRACTLFFQGVVFLLLLILTFIFTIKALEYSEKRRVMFYPPDATVEYLTKEHEALEARAIPLTTMDGKLEDIPFDQFDPKTIEMVKPLRIYSDEYAVYFITGKDWYNGEHGIFIVKDEDNMPPTLNWGLIDGRIYTYALYD